MSMKQNGPRPIDYMQIPETIARFCTGEIAFNDGELRRFIAVHEDEGFFDEHRKSYKRNSVRHGDGWMEGRIKHKLKIEGITFKELNIPQESQMECWYKISARMKYGSRGFLYFALCIDDIKSKEYLLVSRDAAWDGVEYRDEPGFGRRNGLSRLEYPHSAPLTRYANLWNDHPRRK
jgi:hypothetical protein